MRKICTLIAFIMALSLAGCHNKARPTAGLAGNKKSSQKEMKMTKEIQAVIKQYIEEHNMGHLEDYELVLEAQDSMGHYIVRVWHKQDDAPTPTAGSDGRSFEAHVDLAAKRVIQVLGYQ
jgi:hypothetical protein